MNISATPTIRTMTRNTVLDSAVFRSWRIFPGRLSGADAVLFATRNRE